MILKPTDQQTNRGKKKLVTVLSFGTNFMRCFWFEFSSGSCEIYGKCFNYALDWVTLTSNTIKWELWKFGYYAGNENCFKQSRISCYRICTLLMATALQSYYNTFTVKHPPSQALLVTDSGQIKKNLASTINHCLTQSIECQYNVNHHYLQKKSIKLVTKYSNCLLFDNLLYQFSILNEFIY